MTLRLLVINGHTMQAMTDGIHREGSDAASAESPVHLGKRTSKANTFKPPELSEIKGYESIFQPIRHRDPKVSIPE